MAMPSGNVGVSDKVPFQSSGGVAVSGGEIHQHRPRPWYPDERDGLISWFRGEFAASNAIIDALCHHLRAVGEPGEYDVVIGCIQQRRCNWTPVLHMQQYFSVAEVMFALQQVTSRRQQRFVDPMKVGSKLFRRPGPAFKQQHQQDQQHGHRLEATVKEEMVTCAESCNGGNSSSFVGSRKVEQVSNTCEESNATGEDGKLNDKDSGSAEDIKDTHGKDQSNSKPKCAENLEDNASNKESQVEPTDDGCSSSQRDKGLQSVQSRNARQYAATAPRTFAANEIFDGKTVNVMDGLKLYEELLDDIEVSKLLSLVNDLRASGKRGQLQGPTYIVSKRPMKGHGREMIQLGFPIADAAHDDANSSGLSKDRRIESIPSLLQDLIDCLVWEQVMTVKPDSCIIDFYNEGDHSQPHVWPPWFGRPVGVLLLTECEMSFGRVLGSDHSGNYRGAKTLSLAPGSLLVVQGKSADFAKHAIPAMRKQRILVTLTKSQPKRAGPADGQRTSLNLGSYSSWGPPSARSPNARPCPGQKHYPMGPSTGVLPVPPIRPQLPPQNGIPPIMVAPVAPPPMPFPPSVPIPTGPPAWPAAHPRHPPPRLPVPGTGVFLPPGASSAPSPQQMPNSAVETSSLAEKENGPTESDHNGGASPGEKSEAKPQRQECNGSMDGSGSCKKTEEEQPKQQQEEEEKSENVEAQNAGGGEA
ncbi:uncharacterized protein LOC111478296 isoform X1 [Cucurbita maxima]|uniref:Uncharacterized protein LOC111478296 isoform X1 n=1 Tax=Cucurbita maxima TaxID=3661 RepID=A0A6J1ISJ2_CUCMA|nr:uncharacterized protein LOC111478296 isoform X1 [Cucurbita maxima]XP_022978271.1 uncharacterized protein LOC111478296 isoform X1 [Cucurbita maxima]XP_022978276.1 uncharacterized protein LOC111478296 isoform X1 [Cucurbita maxima]XP_022978283.1 uncharacterized protein LOC111478296 isoform X1 [Cucurbita maxima]